MHERSYLLCIPCLLVGCATLAPPPSISSTQGPAVSERKYHELNSVADELNYEDPCTLVRAARGTAFDECLLSFDCTYCRRRGGWWVLTGCDRETTATATCEPGATCAHRAECREGCSPS